MKDETMDTPIVIIWQTPVLKNFQSDWRGQKPERGFADIPKEILCHIIDPLPVYDCFRLSCTQKYMHLMFFSVALKPISSEKLTTMIANYEEQLGGIFFISAKLNKMFSEQKNKPDMTEQEQFYKLEERKKIKYLICTEQGKTYFDKKVGSPLVRSKIANAEFSEQEFLSSKVEVLKNIDERLKEPTLSVRARKNLQLNQVQECLFVGLLTMSEAEGLSQWASAGLADPYIQEEFGNNTLSKECVLNLTKQTCYLLNSVESQRALSQKRITAKVVIQSPIQVELVLKPGVVIDMLRRGVRTASEVLQWSNDSAEIKVLKLKWIWDSTKVQRNDPLFDGAKLIDHILNRAQLLCDIDDKCRETHGNPERVAVEHYLLDVWKNELAIDNCLHANPDALSTLLLTGLDREIAPLVNGGCIDVAKLLKLKPDQIKVLANKKVKWALESGHLKSWTISRLSAKEILDSASSLYSEKAHLEKNCITQ